MIKILAEYKKGRRKMPNKEVLGYINSVDYGYTNNPSIKPTQDGGYIIKYEFNDMTRSEMQKAFYSIENMFIKAAKKYGYTKREEGPRDSKQYFNKDGNYIDLMKSFYDNVISIGSY